MPALMQLETIQSRLLDVGSAVATPLSSSSERKLQASAAGGGAGATLAYWPASFSREGRRELRLAAVCPRGWAAMQVCHSLPLVAMPLPCSTSRSAGSMRRTWSNG